MEETSNNNENINSIGIGVFKPLCVGELNELKDKIHKEQFFDYDDKVDAEKVLNELQNLKNNPKLLDYVIKCLANQKISTTPSKFYAIVVNKESPKPYDEKMWEKIDPENPFERWKKECIDNEWDMKKEDILFPRVFDGIVEIENFPTNIDEAKKEVPYWSTYKDNENILFEKFSIYELGTAAE